jgi:hypothetical protein
MVVREGAGRNPRSRRLAAAGALAFLVVLLAEFAAARADEFSDLRSDQQQLKQQLDELQGTAQTLPRGSGPGTRPSPGQPPVVGGSFPRSFVIPGTDTSVSISGSVQTNFGFGNSR